MIEIETRLHVAGLSGKEVTDFLATCNDEMYQRWWPGTHLHLHTVRGKPGNIGSLLYMDEYIGDRRVKGTGEIVDLVRGQKLVWRMRALVPLPLTLLMEFSDDADGVNITHRIRAGYEGVGRILDPLFRIWLSPNFADAMDAHARAEFPRLRDLLHPVGDKAQQPTKA